MCWMSVGSRARICPDSAPRATASCQMRSSWLRRFTASNVFSAACLPPLAAADSLSEEWRGLNLLVSEPEP